MEQRIRRLLAGLCILLGFLIAVSLTISLERFSWPMRIMAVVTAFASLLGLHGCYVKLRRKVPCPQCQAGDAVRDYDPSGDEFIRCSQCGYHQPTGYSQPND